MQIPSIGLHDDFFALGGHSIVALRIAARVEKHLGRSFPISSFLQAPTVQAQAALSGQVTPKACVPLLTATSGGGPPPVFLVHGVGGELFGFAHLVRELGPGQSVFGIRAIDRDGLRNPFESLEVMAAAYADEIIATQPEGSYYLGGFSVGGWIAFETARELNRRGKDVAMLALFDTHPNCRVPWGPFLVTTASYLFDRLSEHWARWKRLPAAKWPAFLSGRMKAMLWWLKKNNRQPDAGETTPLTQDVSANVSKDRYEWLVGNYRAEPYDGSVDLFLADGAFARLTFFWNLMCRGGVNVHRIQAGHIGMMSNESAKMLSDGLRTVLETARGREAEKAGGWTP